MNSLWITDIIATNTSRAKGNGYEFTRLLPPPKGSGFPPMTTERILFMNDRVDPVIFYGYAPKWVIEDCIQYRKLFKSKRKRLSIEDAFSSVPSSETVI